MQRPEGYLEQQHSSLASRRSDDITSTYSSPSTEDRITLGDLATKRLRLVAAAHRADADTRRTAELLTPAPSNPKTSDSDGEWEELEEALEGEKGKEPAIRRKTSENAVIWEQRSGTSSSSQITASSSQPSISAPPRQGKSALCPLLSQMMKLVGSQLIGWESAVATSQQKEQPLPFLFANLPIENTVRIFDFLEVRDLAALGRTNHSMKKLTEHDLIWKPILQRYYPDCLNRNNAKRKLKACTEVEYAALQTVRGAPYISLSGDWKSWWFGNREITIRNHVIPCQQTVSTPWTCFRTWKHCNSASAVYQSGLRAKVHILATPTYYTGSYTTQQMPPNNISVYNICYDVTSNTVQHTTVLGDVITRSESLRNGANTLISSWGGWCKATTVFTAIEQGNPYGVIATTRGVWCWNLTTQKLHSSWFPKQFISFVQVVQIPRKGIRVALSDPAGSALRVSIWDPISASVVQKISIEMGRPRESVHRYCPGNYSHDGMTNVRTLIPTMAFCSDAECDVTCLWNAQRGTPSLLALRSLPKNGCSGVEFLNFNTNQPAEISCRTDLTPSQSGHTSKATVIDVVPFLSEERNSELLIAACSPCGDLLIYTWNLRQRPQLWTIFPQAFQHQPGGYGHDTDPTGPGYLGCLLESLSPTRVRLTSGHRLRVTKRLSRYQQRSVVLNSRRRRQLYREPDGQASHPTGDSCVLS